MPSHDALLMEAFERFQRRDFAGADALTATLLADSPDDPRVAALAGMIAMQTGAAATAAGHLHRALAAAPDNRPLRAKLGLALLATGRLDEARQVAAVAASVPELGRIVAFVDHQQGRSEDAIKGYRRVLADFPQDSDSWHNLGLLLSADGEIKGAVEAFHRALALRPGQTEIYVGLSRALAMGERHPERQQLLREAVQAIPGEPELLVQLGLAEGAAGDFPAAEAAYRQALALAPDSVAAHLEFAMLLDNLNRLDELDALVADARARNLSGAEIDFAEAWALRRRGRFIEALPLAEAASGAVDPARHAQLIGEIADRVGDADRAFTAFAEMNRRSATGPASDYARARDFPGEVTATIARLTRAKVAAWTPVGIDLSPPAPVFIVGFPRSGTTLLDTLLMGLPHLHIMEEVPAMERTEDLLGDPDRIASLSNAEANRLRSAYFSTTQQLAPPADTAGMVVDKFPLNMVRAALIHRLFPDARFVLVERHPCDVVLSCFMARFQVNRANVQFHSLGDSARLYDLAFQAWTRAAELLPLNVHTVRYERLINDAEGVLRDLLDFLGLAWRPEVLDNRSSAARRGHIATASYAQVGEPIHTRAVDRWELYREHLAPVLPVLLPWAERLGYAI